MKASLQGEQFKYLITKCVNFCLERVTGFLSACRLCLMTGCRENPGGVLLEQQQRQTKGPRAGESVHDPKHCIVVLKLTPKT